MAQEQFGFAARSSGKVLKASGPWWPGLEVACEGSVGWARGVQLTYIGQKEGEEQQH